MAQRNWNAIAAEYIEKNIPCAALVKGEATYLLWIDVQAVGKSREVAEYLRKTTGLFITAGTAYGENGEGFLRMNIACPRALLLDGLERLAKGIATFETQSGNVT